MGYTVQVPGVLHILHNATKDLKKVLSHWKQWMQDLQGLARLLREPYKSRFLATCVQGEARKQRLQAVNPNVYEERWGTVLFAVFTLVELEDDIRSSWSLSNFTFHNKAQALRPEEAQSGEAAGVAEDAEAEERLHIHSVNSTINSEYFWAYTKCIDMLGIVLHQLETFVESCPCHLSTQQILRLGHEHSRYQGSQAKPGRSESAQSHPMSGCPMRGRRAPQLACGEFSELLHSLASMAQQSLLPLCAALTSDEEHTNLGRVGACTCLPHLHSAAQDWNLPATTISAGSCRSF